MVSVISPTNTHKARVFSFDDSLGLGIITSVTVFLRSLNACMYNHRSRVHAVRNGVCTSTVECVQCRC